MVMTASDIEKAYGLLWRSTSRCTGVNEARKLLLATIGRDGQRRGINWVQSTVGPMTDNEILQIEEQLAMQKLPNSYKEIIRQAMDKIRQLQDTAKSINKMETEAKKAMREAIADKINNVK